MSHFTRVQSKIRDIERLKQVLDTLGYAYREAEQGQQLSIKGWEGETAQAVLEINPGCSYGIGVVVDQEGTCELVADWWAIETWTERTQTDFVQEITRQYAYETVMDKVRSAGYSVVTEEQDESNQVRVVVRKWT